MAVPDWPNTFGYNMFFFPIDQWVGGVFYEHSHRLIGSVVGLMTVILAFWLHGRRSRSFLRWLGGLLTVAALATLLLWPNRWTDAFVLGLTGMAALAGSWRWPAVDPAPVWLRRLSKVAVLTVIVQGILGGLRVTQIKDELGIFHGALAQLFFVLICSIALFTSAWWNRPLQQSPAVAPHVPAQLVWTYLVATFLIFAQLVIGATMRHEHAGLAIPDFPLAHGKLWPDTGPEAIERYNRQRMEVFSVKPITATHVVVHMTHRVTALAILVAVGVAAVRTFRSSAAGPLLRKLAVAWVTLIGIQILLGAWTVWSDKAADIATAHVMVGLFSLATGAMLCLIALRERGALTALQTQDAHLLGPSILQPRPR